MLRSGGLVNFAKMQLLTGIMNVDTLLHQYFPAADNVCIEMFDEKNIQQVYRRLVEVLIHQPEVETSLLQGMSYCFYEVMDNVMIHSGKTVGIVITNYSEANHLIQILVADEFDDLFLDNDPELNKLW